MFWHIRLYQHRVAAMLSSYRLIMVGILKVTFLQPKPVVHKIPARNSIVINLLWCRHAHPQLTLPLLRLQLQRLDSIAQPLLLRPQLLVFHLLQRTHGLPSTATSWPSLTALASCTER